MRNYKRERKLYYGYGPASSVTPTQRLHRRENAARHEARAIMAGKVGKRQDVGHKDHNPLNNKRSNLVAMSRSKNRSMNGH